MTDVEAADLETELREIDGLAEAGQHLRALERLEALHLRWPSRLLAQRQVRLRHLAFAGIDRTAGRPRWPDAFDDPFPGVSGIVSARSDELTGSLLGGALTHHGCLRVDGLIEADLAERLCELIDRAFVERDELEDGARTESPSDTFVPYRPGQGKAKAFGRNDFVRVVDVPDAMVAITEAFTTSGVRRAVTDYLGERPVMIANKWVLRRADGGMLLGDFHQDGAFLGEGIRTVNCWIALSDCGPGTGKPAIDLVPTRTDGVLTTGEGNAAFDWSLTDETVHAHFPDVQLASPTFAPGDTMFFDELLVHRTSVGVDLGVRYALESWFVAPSSYPDRHLPIVL